MKDSIQYFTENGIPELEKIKINFMKNPAMFDQINTWKKSRKYFFRLHALLSASGWKTAIPF